MAVELNVDAGELEVEPAELVALAHWVHVACGGHAGDAVTMRRTVARALAAGTRIGAHPSYPDREGFGRRTLDIDRAELVDSIERQCAALQREAAALGAAVVSLKPHGALYHDGHRDPALALAVVDAAIRALGSVTVVGPASGGWSEAARARSVPFAREGFADRGLRPDGSLVPRGELGALIDDPARAAAQAAKLAARGGYDTLCVHGDGPRALEVARAVRAELDRAR